MSDRRALFETATTLLRRMEELNEQIAEGRPVTDARTEAQRLRREWGELMHELTRPIRRTLRASNQTSRRQNRFKPSGQS